ncbi:MAG: tyrosine-protein phosphatase, partial [Tyzzerella sp.]|nr:tyrosine-protein phosphatase [Tyzzerella sp.]
EKLYTTIMADGEAVDVQKVYGTQSNYMYAFEIKNVPTGATIYTRSYIKLTDETVIYGDLREISTPKVLDYEITLVTPAAESTVSLLNADATSWMENFDYTNYTDDVNSLEDAICLGLEDDYYQPVTLSWSLDESADYYVVTYATDSEFSDAKTVTVKAESTKLENLYVATDYYWYVTAYYGNDLARSDVSQFKTADTLRVVTIEGVNNTRDLGGVMSDVYNVRLKQGKIYRTAKLDQITVNGRNQALNDLGIKFDLDLRNPESDSDTNSTTATIGESSPLGTAVKYQNISSGYYSAVVSEDNYALFASELALFADESNYPIGFHCSAGRDRTGTLAVLLYGLLGVDINTIYKDYCTTYLTSDELDENIQTNCLGAFVKMIDKINSVDANGDFHSNVEKLVLEMGVTQEQIHSIRRIMLGSSYVTEEVVD